jgi:hypothetical protein
MQLHSISNYLFMILALNITLLIHGRALPEQMEEQVAHNTRQTCSFYFLGDTQDLVEIIER